MRQLGMSGRRTCKAFRNGLAPMELLEMLSDDWSAMRWFEDSIWKDG